MDDSELIARHPPLTPTACLVWTAVVDVAERRDLGEGPGGRRFLVPIVGGRFYPGEGMDGPGGVVLPGGADRQLLRADGVKELDALYAMRTDDGTTISIRNRGIVDETRKPVRYAMSVISATVREGALAWLNRRLLIGTLQSARPERQAVIVRAWLADAPVER